MTDSGERDPAGTWTLGRRLKEARGSLSLDKIAEKAGVTRETVRSYETGHRADNNKPVNPRPQTLRAIAEAVGIPVREAFEAAGINPRHLRPHEVHQAEPSSALIAKMRRLDPTLLHALEVIVDRVLREGGHIAADAPGPGGQRIDVEHGDALPGHVGVEHSSEFGADVPGVPVDQQNG